MMLTRPLTRSRSLSLGLPKARPEGESASPRRRGEGLRRRQKVYVVLCRERDDGVGRLRREIVDAPEEVVEAAGRRDPEQAFRGRARLVEDAVRLAHGQAHEVARRRRGLLAVEPEIEPALEDVEVLVLRRMDVRWHEGFGREGRVPGEGALGQALRHVGL